MCSNTIDKYRSDIFDSAFQAAAGVEDLQLRQRERQDHDQKEECRPTLKRQRSGSALLQNRGAVAQPSALGTPLGGLRFQSDNGP
ncbi:hypothetical protein EVAR_47928_1 [Eumeta japonica]|uniref:Uncharacterized protein n=1 Tax=Eumeta variegata TaxID=151549 RepID=A0A4C1Y7Y7_EUMVA|nr:hypothetical protein EVAR_47928_1 [Eumeta japonica]